MVRLRPATTEDMPLLQRWDEYPHVRAATGGDAWDWAHELSGLPFTEHFIAEIDGRPVGYMQCIDPAREPSHYWGDMPDGLRALDIWIGEPDDLGKGYGTLMMQAAIERCFSDPSVSGIVIDPLATNTRAHQFYERLGFRFVERRSFGGDECFVYILRRSER